MSRYINFYTVFAFKKIFGTEANKDLLISFLNCLLNLQGDKEIADLTFLNSEQLGEAASERRAIYDMKNSEIENKVILFKVKMK
ncbi:MAG: PD-(D/E)XK nuclease family transposase [Paludibacteraceae bacterium]|nr:PD-(D/E)XK nuclease family transposase [Paludibacteraceae bacterium]MBP5481980.1 PD-(D/E)XK nuclease family transposase [Paludibacteraceae bacterium]